MHDIPLAPGSPWHAGEIALQQRVGVAEYMLDVGQQWIRPAMPLQHQAFFPLLPFVVVGAVDAQGNAWATLLSGDKGFVQASDAGHLSIAAPRNADDPADAGMNDGDPVGMLGIDLANRRRNRVNGIVQRTDQDGFAVVITQSFGNCPRYIHPRRVDGHADAESDSAINPQRSARLDGTLADMVTAADTFFVASFVETETGRQVDVSHRGGPAGFVRLGADGVLTIPDYAGNKFFNTLGNLLLNPKAGLVFVDFATGGLLQVSGDAEVLPDGVGTASFPGAERLWRFTPREVVFRPNALGIRWAAPSAVR
jgi:predicted pyridoxine 5'-phosphate oxidase superfamily flavin-nucleotide-binding protein